MVTWPHSGIINIFRDLVGGGDLSRHKPIKSQIRDWGSAVEDLVGRNLRFSFLSLTDLQSDTNLTNTTGQTYSVSENDLVRAGAYLYRVANSVATDHDVTNSNGVKFYVEFGEAGVLHSKAFGAKHDVIEVAGTGSITATSDVFSATGVTFTPSDVGKTICIKGAGAGGISLVTTISTFVSSTVITVADVASITVANADFYYGTDDTSSLQSALLAYAREQALELRLASGVALQSGIGLEVPATGCVITGPGFYRCRIKKKAGLSEIHPILRETEEGGTFSRVDGFRLRGVSLEGNGDPTEVSAGAAGLIRFYLCDDIEISECRIFKGRGYGIGIQGSDASPADGRQGTSGRIVIRDNEFDSNGLDSYTTSDADDDIDLKACDEFYCLNNKFNNSGDKALDSRSSFAVIEGNLCTNSNNVGISCQPNGSTASSTVPRSFHFVDKNTGEGATGSKNIFPSRDSLRGTRSFTP